MKIDVEMAVFKGINDIGEEVDDATASSSTVVPFPMAVMLETIVASVVAATVTKVDRVVSSLTNGKRVVEDGANGLNFVGASVVDLNVDVIVLIVDAIVVFIGASVAMNGNFGHGLTIGGPSIESNTYPIKDPTVKPMLYESVIIFPVASFNVAGTLDGANIIGNEPANPFVIPRAAVNINAGVSPAIIGCDLGVQHNNNNGIIDMRIVDSRIN